MNFLRVLYRIVFPPNVDQVFSERSKEEVAIIVAARYSRGNAGVQDKRVTTDRKFAEEMDRMAQRVLRDHAAAH